MNLSKHSHILEKKLSFIQKSGQIYGYEARKLSLFIATVRYFLRVTRVI
jgi:hypothetical protein